MSLPFEVKAVTSLNADYDSLVLVSESVEWNGPSGLEDLKSVIQEGLELDKAVACEPTTFYLKGHEVKWMVYSPTGPVNRDYDDVRRYCDAAVAGIQRALKAGHRKPILIVPNEYSFPNAFIVTILGALEALYVPLEIREDVPDRRTKVDALGIFCESDSPESQDVKAIEAALALESGRSVARDIGGSDPERMAPGPAAEYLEKRFEGTSIKISVESGHDEFQKKYPLLSAVDRCANAVPRHRGRVVTLEYVGEGEIKSTYMLVGKGITYDTGGADVKAGGHMAGMHRDKCGAAAVAGFFQVLSVLNPKGIKAVGRLSMVRNSIGAESYVADEIITSAAGVRIRVGNTDAEGRMAMADPLFYSKQQALKEVNPHIMTIATLTGHAIRAMGEGYSIVLDNGPARKKKFAQSIQEAGESMADPFEISTIRREDYTMVRGRSEYEDVLQCNNVASSGTPRGHQFPAAFLIRASGLDKVRGTRSMAVLKIMISSFCWKSAHGIDSDQPLCYSHMDIAASSGPFPGIPTGAPVVALVKVFGLI